MKGLGWILKVCGAVVVMWVVVMPIDVKGQVPVNDDVANAIALSCGDSLQGSLISATSDFNPCTGLSESGVWYSISPGFDGSITASVICCGFVGLNNRISIIQNPSDSLLSSCIVSDLGTCWASSDVSWPVSFGETYYIYVSHSGTPEDLFCLKIQCSSLGVTFPYDSCSANYQVLSTGSDPDGDSVYSFPGTDPYWSIISDPRTTTLEPRPATIIPKYSSWSNPVSGSQWIASDPGDNVNAPLGFYKFQRCFCLNPGFTNPYLELRIMADDTATVYLNDHLVLQADQLSGGVCWLTPTEAVISDPLLFHPGRNCLFVELLNGAIPTAFDLSSTIYTDTNSIAYPGCCEGGIISGIKWNDLNGNGTREFTEDGIPGWVIRLAGPISGGGGATIVRVDTTGPVGAYFFGDLEPGIYEVSEEPNSCWSQTFPASVNYTINLDTSDVLWNIDFGNHFNPVPPPILTFSSDTVCIGDTIGCHLSSCATMWIWNWSDGSTNSSKDISRFFVTAGTYCVTVVDDFGNVIDDCITVTECEHPCRRCPTLFSPIPDERYLLSAWVKENAPPGTTTYTAPAIRLEFEGSGTALGPFRASGQIIDGWQRIEEEFKVPIDAESIRVFLKNTGSNEVFFDDIRIHPFDGNLKSFVYDPVSLRLMAELDENNYATEYEYDEQGQLVRVKKETERYKATIQQSTNSSAK